MSYTFRIVDGFSKLNGHYDQDMDRVQRSSGVLTGVEYTLATPLPGGLYLDVVQSPLVSYKAFPIKRTGIKRKNKLSVGRITLAIGDPDLIIQNILSADPINMKEAQVVIRRTYNSLPNGALSSYRTVFVGSVTNYSFNANNELSVECSDRWFDWQSSVNKRSYNKMCGFKFKEARCGYVGAETFCNKSLPKCIDFGNDVNFGGFPSIANTRFTGIKYG